MLHHAKYVSRTTFELLNGEESSIPSPRGYDQLYRVAANGASCIEFRALPMRWKRSSAGAATVKLDFSVLDGKLAGLRDTVARVNDIPLFPTILDIVDSLEMSSGNFFNRLAKGDSLKFEHAPNVADETIYDVYFPDAKGVSLNAVFDIMVIRTFTTQIH